MSSAEEIRREREAKRDLLRERGMDPYPATTHVTHAIATARETFSALEDSGENITIGGRLLSLRRHGGSTFGDLFDGTARVQIFLSEDAVGADAYALFTDTVDQGDFVEVSGTAFITKRGEETIAVGSWRMLAKSLQAIPSEFYGLKDDDERYRKRYLDLLLKEDIRALFVQKAKFWDTTRAFLKEYGFLEVETPTLEVTTGGAEARPFETHHNDFDIDVYLRISVGELWQKRLMAAGFPRTFEIGRVYRNEGSSPEHLQEFTNMECYAAFMNFEEGKELVKNLYRILAQEVFGRTSFTYKDHAFDLADEWPDLDYVSTIEEMTGVNVLEATDEALADALRERGVEYEGENRERMTDSLWKFCRRQIAGPAFLVNHPKLVAPLSKEHLEDPRLTKTFQVILAGSELGRAHAELNDPGDQRARFEAQQKLLEAGDEEAMMPDWDYVEAMENGMPPMFGFGVGERLFSFMAGLSIREAQLFPLVKPKNS